MNPLDHRTLSSATLQQLAALAEWLGYFGVIPDEAGYIAATVKQIGDGAILPTTGSIHAADFLAQGAVLRLAGNGIGTSGLAELATAFQTTSALRQLADAAQCGHELLKQPQGNGFDRLIGFPIDIAFAGQSAWHGLRNLATAINPFSALR